MSRRKRILFAISDTGGGHRSGAQALHAALLQHPQGRDIDYDTIDLITATGLPLLRNAPKLYDHLSTRWLPLFNLFFQLTNGRRRVDTIAQIAYLTAQRNIKRTLDEFKPDLVVSVHPIANRFIGHARATYTMPFRFMTVVTDLVSLHTSWGDPDADVCIAPTHEGAQVLIDQGMPVEKVVYAGFPVHPKFTACTFTTDMARHVLHIDRERFTVLLTAGGVGSGRLRELVISLHQAYPAMQLLVVTGRNAALRNELQRLNLPEHVRIYGFVDNMEQLMAASDVVVTKAGPGTLMEALVMRRPVVITEAVGLQERGNITFVLDRGLGAHSRHIRDIVQSVGDLMDPEHHAATVARLQDAVPRDGAQRIANIIIEQLHTTPPTMSRQRRSTTLMDLPRWMRQRDHVDESRRRMRLFSVSIIEHLRQQSRNPFQWRYRIRRKNRKSNSNS
ncbi:MAG: glycosyltransferase [Chloroflexi bacterium]|nr:glycosyltransferase [Chloroflexota bacterium]